MSIVQTFFAVTSLISCHAAVRAALLKRAGVAESLLCAGASSLAFFISVPGLPLQFSGASVLTLIAGAIFGFGRVARATADLGESTLARRMRNRDVK